MMFCLPNGETAQSAEELLEYLIRQNAQGPGGQETFRLTSSLASTNATSVASSATSLYKVSGYNSNAAARYLKLYDKASAPTVGTDTPIWVEYLPAQSSFDWAYPPLRFSKGLAFAFTTGAADSNTVAVGAGDIQSFNLLYV